MKEIVAVDLNWGIGYKGKLLQQLPEDMKRFKRMTTYKVVVMGVKTFASLQNQQPLKNRTNIVLCNDKSLESVLDGKDVILCRSLDELFIEIKKYNTDDIFVIGGGTVYSLLLPYCNEAHITKIEGRYKADTHYPNLDEDKDWIMVTESRPQDYNGIIYKYLVYRRRQPETVERPKG